MVADRAQRLLQVVRGDIGEILQVLVALAQALGLLFQPPLHLLALGDVAQDAAVKPAVAEADFADRQLKGHRPPIGRQADDLARRGDKPGLVLVAKAL